MLTLAIFCGFAPANGALIDLKNAGGEVVYDTVAHEYWIQNLKLFYGMSFQDKLGRIDGLNSSSYFGINTWRLAPLSEMTQLWDNPASDFLKFEHTYVFACTDYYDGVYDSVSQPGSHYTGTVKNLCSPPPGSVVMQPLETRTYTDEFYMGGGPSFPSAWVSADAPASVPEPGTLVFVGAGLFALVLYSKRFRSNWSSM